MSIESPSCTYCHSYQTVRVVPDRLTVSPWQCQDCGAVFGTSDTDSGLLRQHGRPPYFTVTAAQDEIACSRCGELIDEDDLNQILTAQGPVCGDCLTLEELREI